MGTSLTPEILESLSIELFGTTMVLNPSFLASSIRLSNWDTRLTSPVSPNSPTQIQSSGKDFSSKLDQIAAAAARSQAGSEILRPPATLKNKSCSASESFKCFSRIAASNEMRVPSMPTEVRRGTAKDVGETNA